MGVPTFLPWLYRKYPSIFVKAVEQQPEQQLDEQVATTTANATAAATSEPPVKPKTNPIPKVECDNFYIDMNGIIHQCTHPDEKPCPESEDEMMAAIFESLDHLFSIVKPRKLFYMAIDGVAPRAKMNQQRSRRFTAAYKRTLEETANEEKIFFDGNCITPGTPFMTRLGNALRYYINDRLNNNPDWVSLKVILSDASVPGEGEHKIMDFIRKQRAMPQHNPNTHHVLYGADADLIMLALSTHEPRFTIIREDFRKFFKWKRYRGKRGPKNNHTNNVAQHPNTVDATSTSIQSLAITNEPSPQTEPNVIPANPIEKAAQTVTGTPAVNTEEVTTAEEAEVEKTEFVYLRVNVLREYLQRDLFVPDLPFKFDTERIIDDWVFLCLFIGNDFLPHLPSLMIREGAIHRLLLIYKKCLPELEGYITHNGHVDFERARHILVGIALGEDDAFQDRRKRELQRRASAKSRDKNKEHKEAMQVQQELAPEPVHVEESEVHEEAAEVAEIVELSEPSDHETESEPEDPIRLWEAGWRERYFKVKFNEDSNEFRVNVARQYAIGLSWVFRYYYQGAPSWNWYYPFHYPPVATDFLSMDKVEANFDSNSQPFEPFEQLLAVLPTGSKDHIPAAFQKLMYDPQSDIVEYYPTHFRIDKTTHSRDGTALLPFVDENRLKNAMKPHYSELTEEEKLRNTRGSDCLFVNKSHPSYQYLHENVYVMQNQQRVNLIPTLVDGMTGKVWKDENYPANSPTFYKSPLSNFKDLENNNVLSVRFCNPQFMNDHVFQSGLLSGIEMPDTVLKRNKRHRKPRANKKQQDDQPISEVSQAANSVVDSNPTTSTSDTNKQ